MKLPAEYKPQDTPAQRGYYFPAEWESHRATWLSWPHKKTSWPGRMERIFAPYIEFIRILSRGERVCININNPGMQQEATLRLGRAGVDLEQIDFFLHPTNDAWCRDHGPAFLVHPGSPQPKAIVDWGYNAWGNKYPPFDLDDQVPTRTGTSLGLPVFHPGIILEGGSVEFNGQGTLLTTTSCLLHPNRNPGVSREELSGYLRSYFGVRQILWLGDGILGDDTDGHIDDLVRFTAADRVVCAVETDSKDGNFLPLQRNLETLRLFRLPDGRALEIVELPMPAPVYLEKTRLPASYANFYIANRSVIVPTFRDPQHDPQALGILRSCFPDREVVGLDSRDIIWGLGSFHCLSQQEPETSIP